MTRVMTLAGNTMVGLAAVGFVLLGVFALQRALGYDALSQSQAPTAELPDRNPLSQSAPSTQVSVPDLPPVTAIPGAAESPSDVMPARGDDTPAVPADASAPTSAAAGVDASTNGAPGTAAVAAPPVPDVPYTAPVPPAQEAPAPVARSAPAASAREAPALPPVTHEITRLEIPSIGLDTRVALAKYVSSGGGTWQIPPFIVGHAQFTAGAGEIGNALLFGHVTSVSVGNVFETLDQVHRGDIVDVFSDNEAYEYRVVDISAVSRDDVSLLGPTTNASVSLITCTGNWLPLERDYDQRLIVRAELVDS